MASAQVVETSVNTNNSPSQDYTTNPDDHSNHNNDFSCLFTWKMGTEGGGEGGKEKWERGNKTEGGICKTKLDRSSVEIPLSVSEFILFFHKSGWINCFI